MKTQAELFQESNRSAQIDPPAGARAIVVIVLFGDKSVSIHGGADERLTTAMLAGAADMYGVGPGDVGVLGDVHDPFANGQTALA